MTVLLFRRAMEVVKIHGLVSQVSHFSLFDSKSNWDPAKWLSSSCKVSFHALFFNQVLFFHASSCCFSAEVTILALSRRNFEADAQKISAKHTIAGVENSQPHSAPHSRNKFSLISYGHKRSNPDTIGGFRI